MIRTKTLATRSVQAAALPVVEALELRRLYAAQVAPTPTGTTTTTATHAPKKPGKIDLEASSDNGSSSTDNLTSVQAPVFDVDRVDPNVTLQLMRDGVVVASVLSGAGGTVAIQDFGPVTAGAHVYTTRAVSAAGLSSADGSSITVTFVVVPVPAAPDLAAASDSGSSDTDNVTSASSLSFVIGNVVSGQTVQLMRDGVVVASGVASGTSITLVDAAVAEGVHSYSAMAVDSRGFSSAAGSALTVTVDRTAPATAGTPDLAPASDTGSSDADDLTAAGTLSFVVSGVENGATVELLRDGVVVGSGVAAGGSVTLSDSGAGDGAHAYAARQTDAAGNTGSAGVSLNVTVDTTAPAAPGAPDLRAASDTGSSSTDNITNAAGGLVFDISGLEAGSMVELLRNGVVVASGVAGAGSDSVSLSDPASLSDGVYQYATRQTDAAGNVGAASAAVAVTVDTTAPAAASTPTLALVSDSGIKGDGVTRDRRPVFTLTGLDLGATVQVLADGVVIATATVTGGTMSLGAQKIVAPGTHQFSVQQVDAAGNAGAASNALTLTMVNATAGSDFDGDGLADIAVYTNGTWEILLSSGGSRTEDFGDNTTVPVTGDYDGDGITDVAVYAPGVFIIEPSSQAGGAFLKFFGTGSTPLPAQGDYDGDGLTDIATYDLGTGRFDVALSGGGLSEVVVGSGGDALPVVADYDGDGKADAAVYDPNTGVWTIAQSTGGTITRTFGGGASQVPVPGDFDGDGFDDLAVYDRSTGTFSVFASGGGTLTRVLGTAGSIPAVADYDGDGKTDFAAYSQATATFSIFHSMAGFSNTTLGTASDGSQPIPLSAAQIRQDLLGY